MNSGRLVGFARNLRAEVAAGEGVFLFSEQGVTVLRGAQVEALATLLDGTRSVEALLGTPPDGMGPEQVANVLARLAEAGVITIRPPRGDPAAGAAVAYWEAAGLDAASAQTAVSGGAVGLLTVGELDDLDAVSSLRAAGLTVAAESAAALSVVLCDDYLNPRLAEIDAAHRVAGRPWLLAKPVGAKVWCGPVFQPDATGCWHCLAVRLWGHRTAEAAAQSALGRTGPAASPVAAIGPLVATAMSVVALEATKWLAGYRYSGQSRVWTFDGLAGQAAEHELRARPQCPACGNPELIGEQARRPVVLSARRKASESGGGHRALGPEQVLERYRHLISPVTGIVKEIRRDKRGPAFFNSFRSGPNVAARPKSMNALWAALRMDCGGKGVTALHAEVSALCEAAERHSGNFHGDEERIQESLRSLGERAIHPNDSQLFDARQFASREAWNAAHGRAQHVPREFDTGAILDWTPVWSLTNRRHRYLPTGLLYYGAPGQGYVHADSNGNAAGSSLEDAVLQGLLELVERDAVAIWWYNRARVPAVDLDAFGDPWIDEVRGVYAGLHRDVWILDVTSDLGIPVMVALSRRFDRRPEEIMFGLGAHLDPRVALRRALTELNQLMPAVVNSTGTGDYGWEDPDVEGWWRHATAANQPYLRPDPAERPRTPVDYDYVARPDLAEDVAAVQRGIEKLGMEVLVLDQTRPDIGLPVVKVIVPGLRHFWARLGPGRLYDVPVRLGRQTRPTPYAELNPIPMFL